MTPEAKVKKSMGGVKRQTVSVSETTLVTAEPLSAEHPLPLLVQPSVKGIDLVAWASANKEYIQAQVYKYGGILLRNFEVTVPSFDNFMINISGELLQDPARTGMRGPKENVYISTFFPAEHTIYFHNETWWQYSWPMNIFFHCDVAPEKGGETIIADCRAVLGRLDPAIVRRFEEKKVLHVRNFGNRFGLPWQEVFDTDDRAEVEAFCRANEISVEWKDGDRLTTRHIRPAVARHPQTGERTWFNHIAHYHVSTNVDPAIQAMLADMDADSLPVNTYYGDGTPIEDDVTNEIRAAYNQETVAFPWQKGDVLMLDNMLVAHGRAPFQGPRKILVGMTDLRNWHTI